MRNSFSDTDMSHFFTRLHERCRVLKQDEELPDEERRLLNEIDADNDEARLNRAWAQGR